MPLGANSCKLLETGAQCTFSKLVRILVVEDDKKIASFVVNGLKQNGFAVDHSTNGEDAYALVQRNAMKVWESDGALSLLDLLKADAEVTQRLPDDQLNALFDLDYHLKHVDTIFSRIFD